MMEVGWRQSLQYTSRILHRIQIASLPWNSVFYCRDSPKKRTLPVRQKILN
jgi:hypothetical protein